jgi:hypothetical protein
MIWMPRIAASRSWCCSGAVVALVYGGSAYCRWRGAARGRRPAGEVSIERDASGIPTIRGQIAMPCCSASASPMPRIGCGSSKPIAASERAAGRSLRTGRAGQRQVPSRARCAPGGDGAMGTDGGDARTAVLAYTAGINAFIERPPAGTAAGVPHSRPAAGTLDARRHAGLGHHDGLGSRRQLGQRTVAHAPGADHAGGAHQRTDSALSGRESPAGARLRRPLSRTQARRRPRPARPADAPESGVEGVGSNNWVLAGSHTTSGKPLLANDPHLKLTTPALWYFARLDAPGFKVAGATMPGLPMVVLGQNERIAWGFTNTNPDVQDVYLEQVNPTMSRTIARRMAGPRFRPSARPYASRARTR